MRSAGDLPMIVIARLLVRERLRRLGRHYGWACYASVALMFAVFMSAGAVAAGRYVRQSTAAGLGATLSLAWLFWVVAGLAAGKDLSWQIRLDRVRVFPVPGFTRLFATAFLLGYLSLPLAIALAVFEFWTCLKAGFSLSAVAATLLGGCLYIASIRLTVSLLRAALYEGRYCAVLPRLAGGVAALPLPVLSCLAILHPRILPWLPGQSLALILIAERWLEPLAGLAAWTGFLAVFDFALRRSLTFAGCSGPLSPGGRLRSNGGTLLAGRAWPGPVFRIAVLGWLRSRSVLMIFLWGMTYGFFFMYFSRPEEALDFFLFVWVVQVFHGFLRGNLLGTDRGAVWLYHMFPVAVETTLSSRSHALNLLQGCMIAAVLLGGFLTASPQVTIQDWGRILIYAISSVQLGELVGWYFSVKHPDPIDRTSQFSGGMTAGALLVPLAQLVYLGLFFVLSGLARRFAAPPVFWALALSVPLPPLMMRRILLRTWVRKHMLAQRESIWKKLSTVPL
jgi:hypothetical protein